MLEVRLTHAEAELLIEDLRYGILRNKLAKRNELIQKIQMTIRQSK